MRALLLLVALAGCDRVFGLGDPYEDAPAGARDGTSDTPISPGDSGSGSGAPATEIAHFLFDGNYDDQVSHTGGTCVRTSGLCTFGMSRTGTGMAASFDGQTCITFQLPAMPTSLTVAMWVDPLDGLTRTLLERPTATGFSWLMQEDNDSLLFSTNMSGNVMSASRLGGPAAGAWHSIVITVSPQETRFYLDGIDEGAGGGITLTYTGTTLAIGCSGQTTATDNYNSLMDDLVIFDGVVNSAQLAQLF